MNKLKIAVLSIAMLVGVVALVPSIDAGAAAKDEINKGFIAAGGTGEKTLQVRITEIVNIMLYIIGALSVIVIIFGGIRYVTSTGDASRVKAAKDTIMYAVIGLAIAILAYAIVNFVLTNL